MLWQWVDEKKREGSNKPTEQEDNFAVERLSENEPKVLLQLTWQKQTNILKQSCNYWQVRYSVWYQAYLKTRKQCMAEQGAKITEAAHYRYGGSAIYHTPVRDSEDPVFVFLLNTP